ncbi:MAG: GNAT family N-acetyltransferase [Vicinamibacterales bacterium]
MTVEPLRLATPDDLEPLADLWHEGWRDAHAAILPADLTALRTRDSFVPRLRAALADLWVAGPPGAPLGFCMLRGDELSQLFVARHVRGAGLAARLLAAAEDDLRRRGVLRPWLACAIGNDRAARFYEKHAWRRTGVVVVTLSTTAGPYALEVWRYEKDLADHAAGAERPAL